MYTCPFSPLKDYASLKMRKKRYEFVRGLIETLTPFIFFFALLSPALCYASATQIPATTMNSWVVEMKKPLTPGEVNALAAQWRGFVRKFTSYHSPYFERLYYAVSPLHLEVIRSHKNVEKIESISAVDSFSVEKSNEPSTYATDPLIGFQWGVENTLQTVLHDRDDITVIRKKGMREADVDPIAMTAFEPKMNRDVVVAIIDSGLDVDHPDIEKSVFVNEAECINGEPPLIPKDDKDNNSYKGDCKGWNFTGKDGQFGHRVTDETGHGTHVAGIIAATANNEIGITGVSNRIKILPIKIFTRGASPNGSLALTDRIAKALLYAVQMKADVINLSLGWPLAFDKKYIREAIAEAQAQGVMIVAAAGNNNHSASILPCAIQGVLCVGSLDNDYTVSAFSNFGMHVDVLAPGDNILSLLPMGLKPELFSISGYDFKSGTSQAAPYVSALAAILRGLSPQSTSFDIFNRIKLSSRAITDPHKTFLAGAISLKNAIEGRQQDILLPEFKENNRVVFDLKTGDATYKFVVTNPSTENKTAHFQFKSSNQNLKIEKSKTQMNLSGKSSVVVSVQMRVLNPEMESQTQVEIAINGHLYKSQIDFERAFHGDPKLEVVRAPTLTDPQLLSLPAQHFSPERPEYYRFKIEENLLNIHVFQIENAQLNDLGEIELPNVINLIAIKRLDFNADGILDFQVVVLQSKEKKSQVVYYNYDSELRPLANAPFVTLKYDGMVQFEPELGYLYKSIANSESVTLPMAVPIFTAVGPVPALDQFHVLDADGNPTPERDYFKPEITSKGLHIYYFTPQKNEAGGWEYVTRILDAPDQLNVWRRELKLPFLADVRLLHVLPQSERELRQNSIKVLASFGLEFQRELAVLDVTLNAKGEPQLQWNFLNSLGVPIDSYNMHENLDLTGRDEIRSTFVGAHNSEIWNLVDLNWTTGEQEKHILRTQDLSEDLLVYLKSYRTNHGQFSFIQTVSEMLLAQIEDGKTKYWRKPFHVTTFLPGYLFSEKGFPLWFGDRPDSANGGSLPLSFGRQADPAKPALYIDASQLVSKNAYLLVGDQNGLTSPARMNVEIPNNCRALNPSLWNQKTYKFTLLCNDQNGWALSYLPMN